MVYDDHESDEDDEDAVSLRSEEDDFVEERLSDDEEEDEEEAINDESDYLEELEEEDEDDASYCTESSHGSAAGTHAPHETPMRARCGLENGRSAADLSLLTETLKMDPGAFLGRRRPRV